MFQMSLISCPIFPENWWKSVHPFPVIFMTDAYFLERLEEKSCIQGLNHWGPVTHICVSKLSTIGSDNGLSPDRHQAIIWINAGILLIRHLATNFNEMLIEIHTFSVKKKLFKMSSGKRRSFCLNVLKATTPKLFLVSCAIYFEIVMKIHWSIFP